MVAERISSLGIELHEVPISAPALKQLPDAQPPFSEVPNRKNLVARVPGSRHGRSLILNCHLDIVPAGNLEEWTRPAFGGQVDEARRIIYGRGAMDDKAGVAIGLAVLELAASKVIRPQGDLIVQFVLEDESTGNGSLLCLSNGFTADAAIILDGTRRDWGINQHVGSMQFAIEMPGRPASVSVSHMGINAAEMLSELLLELRSSIFALNDARAAPWTQYPSPNQFVTQSFNAEGRQLTVPDRAGAICYLTFTPPHTLQELRQRIEVIAHDFAGQRRIGQPRLRWEGFFACEPVASASRELEAVI